MPTHRWSRVTLTIMQVKAVRELVGYTPHRYMWQRSATTTLDKVLFLNTQQVVGTTSSTSTSDLFVQGTY